MNYKKFQIIKILSTIAIAGVAMPSICWAITSCNKKNLPTEITIDGPSNITGAEGVANTTGYNYRAVYDTNVIASNGTWSFKEGTAIPTGVYIDENEGKITWSDNAKSCIFTIQYLDGNGLIGEEIVTLVLSRSPAPIPDPTSIEIYGNENLSGTTGVANTTGVNYYAEFDNNTKPTSA
ncbi:MAG: hypothetical protein LBL60_00320, partial [Mycoplasmataceae bacterium]|nr:hypothetical protein [Mycoplasmataceae bacterium]